MPGTSAGTGYPLVFRCSKCKVGRSFSEVGHSRLGMNLETTGRVHVRAFDCLGSRSLWYHCEYRCLDCRHVGWSRHSDMLCYASRMSLDKQADMAVQLAKLKNKQPINRIVRKKRKQA